MADFEFVMEAPQATRTNKKRPRLVTSCDYCRVKKIKCVQHPASGKCEACHAANIPCLYRDREQYFAERTRMLSGTGSALRDASSNASSSAHLSAINASTPSSSRGITPPQSSHGRSSPSSVSNRSNSPAYYPSANVGTLDNRSQTTLHSGMVPQPNLQGWEAPMPPQSWIPRRGQDLHVGLDVPIPQPSSDITPLYTLFDAHDSTQPHPNLMMSFLQDFFDKLGSMYPFLSSDSIYDRFLHQRLPPLLSNAIAALATPFSTLPAIQQLGPPNAADVYCQMAKNLVPPDGAPASLDTLHAVMLLAWAEYKRNNHAMFNSYARTVTRIAAELGISEETLPQLMRVADPRTARMLQGTWQGIQQIERTLLASELVALSSSAPSSHSHMAGPSHTSHSSQLRPGDSLW